MVDERFELANKLAKEIQIKAEELSTSIYQARKYGYDTSLRVRGVLAEDEDEKGSRINKVENVLATIVFDIGRAI